MTNEEFQKIVLEELKGLREDVADLRREEAIQFGRGAIKVRTKAI